MTIRMFFTILAVLSFLFGVGFVLAPDQVLANYGIEHSPALALLGRLFGGALLTLGVILWLARDFRDEAAVRTVLIGGGCDALIPSQPPKEALAARIDRANDHVHTVPTQKRGYRPGRKSQERQTKPGRKPKP